MTTAPHAARVAVVGGSIAGCAAALATYRAGHDVTVYERSGGDLAERGFGIALPTAVHQELVAAGYLGPRTPALPMTHRPWVIRETGGDGWRELWRQRPSLLTYNWGLLWRSLRAGVPDAIYRTARHVTGVRRADDGHAVLTVHGEGDVDCDLVIGADGYRSVVREAVVPGSTPQYAGYVAFRGTIPLGRLSDDPQMTEFLSDAGPTALFDGGHVIVYLIPDADGGRRVNWVLYALPPRDVEVDPGQGSFAPGTVLDDLIAWGRKLADTRLPARIGQIIARTPDAEMALQPIFDLPLDTSVRMPFLLIGDANAITRPHTASGAVKALQEALCLEQALRSSPSTADAAAAFNAERNPVGNRLVEHGRRIGRDQVESTPDWSTMDAEAMRRYVTATGSGQRHYLFSDDDD